MNLVLQCAMCGTHHPVGTRVCSTCRATGVTQLRLMFECPSCGHLGLDPVCAVCPAPTPSGSQAPDEDLVVAEEVFDEPLSLDDDEIDLAFDEDEIIVVDLSEDDAGDSVLEVEAELAEDESDSDDAFDDSELDDRDDEYDDD